MKYAYQDADIFTWVKYMRAEAIAAFIIIFLGFTIVEYPASMVGAARPMHQEAMLIRLPFPESSDAAGMAMLLPRRGVDMTVSVERPNELVAMLRRSLGELLRTGETEPDTFERVRKGSHGRC